MSVEEKGEKKLLLETKHMTTIVAGNLYVFKKLHEGTRKRILRNIKCITVDVVICAILVPLLTVRLSVSVLAMSPCEAF